ncbi:hypothetical protein RJO15_18720 [Herbaspirillum huttiense F1]|uniref:hypothetical protein n=1 Tax=Herbaspirillum huttiense TaxID=863372 RepID=UPI002884367E|nr:hypothetical protein [Herbaspirillum huttiense]MDT0357830.1 hypothetical protein [Herbaspirillum huttiense F1]
MQNDQIKPGTATQQTKPADKTNTPLRTVKIADGMPLPNEASESAEQASQKATADSKDKKANTQAPVKMQIATAIYLRMQKNKNITRKEIIDEFVKEAKLSKAGASTYYQLIKTKQD